MNKYRTVLVLTQTMEQTIDAETTMEARTKMLDSVDTTEMTQETMVIEAELIGSHDGRV